MAPLNHAYDGGGNLTSIRGNLISVDKNPDLITSAGISGCRSVGATAKGELDQFIGRRLSRDPSKVLQNNAIQQFDVAAKKGIGTPA